MNNIYDSLKENIIEYVSTVAGVHGFVSLNLDDNEIPRSLKSGSQTRSIFITEGPKGLIVKIAIIIKQQINAKAIIQGAHQAIQTAIKEADQKLDSIVIYVRGAMI